VINEQQLMVLGIIMGAAMLFFTAMAIKNASYNELGLEGSLTEAIHRILLDDMPGICLDEFALLDAVNNMTKGDVITVHGVGKYEFCIRVWHETIHGKVKILDIEAKDGKSLSLVMQCKFEADKPFRNKL